MSTWKWALQTFSFFHKNLVCGILILEANCEVLGLLCLSQLVSPTRWVYNQSFIVDFIYNMNYHSILQCCSLLEWELRYKTISTVQGGQRNDMYIIHSADIRMAAPIPDHQYCLVWSRGQLIGIIHNVVIRMRA